MAHSVRYPKLEAAGLVLQLRGATIWMPSSSVADDPQARVVVAELSARYRELEPEVQADVVLLTLPLASHKQNTSPTQSSASAGVLRRSGVRTRSS